MTLPRFMLFLTLAAFTSSCASQRLDWISEVGQSDGSKSDGSKSDGSKSDNSNDGNSSNSGETNSSDGPSSETGSENSDSRSATSGTVTTEGDGSSGDGGTGTTLLVLLGVTLIGLAIAGTSLLAAQDGPGAYLEKHGREVRLALARGDGTFVRDVGHNLGLADAEVPHLGRVLRDARGRLEAHIQVATEASKESGTTQEEITTRGRRFAAELARVLLEDPTLGAPARKILDDLTVSHRELLESRP